MIQVLTVGPSNKDQPFCQMKYKAGCLKDRFITMTKMFFGILMGVL